MDSPVSDRPEPTCEAILTPRSKVKALLAQLDDGSDDDDDDDDRSSNSPEAHDDGSPLPLPKGRLAARLKSAPLYKATTDHDAASSSNERDQLADTAVPKAHQPGSPNRPALRRRLFTKTKDGRQASPRALEFPSRSQTESSEAVPSNVVSNDDDAWNGQSSVHGLVVPTSDAILEADTEGAGPIRPGRGHDNSRFLELVAKKRAEREARESAEEEARSARAQRLQQSSDRLDELLEQDGDADAEDPAAGEAMFSQLKPSRKAGKKALEAMNRETQRLTRNQQLAHAATTRKKYSVVNFFSRFGAGDAGSKSGNETLQQQMNLSAPASPKSSSQADNEAVTPPTSPATPEKHTRGFLPKPQHPTDALAGIARGNDGDESQLKSARLEDELPSIDKLFDTIPASGDNVPTVNHDLVIAPVLTKPGRQDVRVAVDNSSGKHKEKRRLNFRVEPSKSAAASRATSDHSEDDLDIAVPDTIVGRFTHLLNRPVSEARADSKSRLKSLAHLSSPSKRAGRSAKPTMPITQMCTNLMAQARKQAALERSERIEDLRAKGVVIQTAEEREKDQMVTEDLLEKARNENEELTKREREERKRNGEATDLMDLDDSDDESYLASGDERSAIDPDAENELDEESDDVEYSGSEDEQEQEDQADAGTPSLKIFEEEASEDGSGPENPEVPVALRVVDSQDDEMQARKKRRSRAHRVLDDDDDDDVTNDDETEINRPSELTIEPDFPNIVNPFARGPQVGGRGTTLPMGLSQAFAATMEVSQTDEDDLEQSSAALTPQVPEPNLPIHETDQMVRSSSRSKSLDLILTDPASIQHEPLTQEMPFDGTQLSEMPEPTQDMGISTTSPIAERFATVQPSTIDTVLLPHAASNAQTEMMKKKGRLIRGRNDTAGLSLGDVDYPSSLSLNNIAANVNAGNISGHEESDAFQAMKRAEQRRAQAEAFDRKKSTAKQMIEEQAEESEDEYAGLGGASDDESGGELDDETRKMLNDEQVNLNESELAAYHANKERVDDDKAVRKLLTDIESGMLRRKRGGNGAFDELSDSEDERQERLLRARQDRESRQRKALLLDENLGKIAENPKKAAFLAAVEDRQGEVEGSFLDDAVPAPSLLRNDSVDEIPDSQPRGDDDEGSSSQRNAGEKRKRPLEELDPNKRAPFSNRRTNRPASNKPQSLAEIRETLSFLIEEPHQRSDVQVAATQLSDAEDETSASRFADRRRKNSVVDRLFLKRAESTETAKSTSRGRLAFHTRGSEDHSLTTPSLLRRATTQNTGDARDVVYASDRAAGGKARSDRDQIRRGGTKKSSVAYFAREADRRKAVDKVEKRRDLQLRKATEGRRGVLRGLHGGTFE